MEFMLMLYEDPDLVTTEQQRTEAVQRVGEYAMGLVGDGTLKGGAPLHPVTEAKEVIAGYFVIEAPDVESAVAIAARCPNAEFGSVEVREIAAMG